MIICSLCKEKYEGEGWTSCVDERDIICWDCRFTQFMERKDMTYNIKICRICKAEFKGQGNKALISQRLTVCDECSIAENRIEQIACDRVIAFDRELMLMIWAWHKTDYVLSKFYRR